MPEIKGAKKITEAEKEIFNAMLALNLIFQEEKREAEKQENFERAEEVAKLREHLLEIARGIVALKIELY